MPWRGIKPLRSDKQDVRRLLGQPKLELEDRMEFEGRFGRAVIFFYTEEDARRLELSPAIAGKVLLIYLYPRKPERNRKEVARRLKAVGRGFTSEGEPMTSYDDGERGISYQFKGEDDRVWRIAYYAPRSEFEKIARKR